MTLLAGRRERQRPIARGLTCNGPDFVVESPRSYLAPLAFVPLASAGREGKDAHFFRHLAVKPVDVVCVIGEAGFETIINGCFGSCKPTAATLA